MCLESLRTLLALPSMDKDDMWRWQSPTEEPGSTLVPNDGVRGHVAHRTWRGDIVPEENAEKRVMFVLTLD